MGVRTYHIEKDAVKGDYHIKDKTIPYTKLQENTIEFYVSLMSISTIRGLPADSTGVKAVSGLSNILKKHIKEAKLIANISSIPSDATVRVELYDNTKGTVIASLEFAGETGRKETSVDLSTVNDGDELVLRANVTTASGTSGATFDIWYASFVVKIGIS